MLTRKTFLAAIGFLSLSASSIAVAQGFPARPIKLVVGQPPGGASDAIARAVGEKVAELLGQPVVIDNRVGANGGIATAAVARAEPDGYTLTLGVPGPFTVNQYLYSNLTYDPPRDFRPIANLASATNVIVTTPKVGANTLADYIALARSQPGKLSYASGGTGATGHLVVEQLAQAAKINIVHVPYKGVVQALTDMMAGQTTLMATPPASLLQHIQAGTLKPLAVTSSKRNAALPNVPTVQELGFPGFEGDVWYGILAPANVPDAIAAKLEAAFQKAVADPGVQRRIASLGLQPNFIPSGEFRQMLAADAQRWQRVIKTADIKLD